MMLQHFFLNFLFNYRQSFTDWNAGNGECNVEFLGKILPLDVKVPVAKCSEKYFDSQRKVDMTLKDYLQYWKNRSPNEEILYLKDWHLRRQCQKYSFYRSFRQLWIFCLNPRWNFLQLLQDPKVFCLWLAKRVLG